jgi:hypothetical protein
MFRIVDVMDACMVSACSNLAQAGLLLFALCVCHFRGAGCPRVGVMTYERTRWQLARVGCRTVGYKVYAAADVNWCDVMSIMQVCGPPPMYKAICGMKAEDKSQGELSGTLKDMGYTKDMVFKF